MKVLLVATPVVDLVKGRLRPVAVHFSKECPPYGMYLLASVLRSSGHDVVLADLIAERTHSIGHHGSAIQDCSLVGIGATSLSWPTAVEVVSQVRRSRPDVPIVVGGIHPTMFDLHILHNFDVDYVVRGEAELSLPALCQVLERAEDLEKVPGLTWRSKDGKIVRNPIGPKIPVKELGHFPLPDFSNLPLKRYNALSIESSRGCPFDCAFCSTAYRQTWRPIPPEVFVNNLERIMQHVPRTSLGVIHIVDDQFSSDSKRLTKILQLIRKKGLRPKLVHNLRADDLLSPPYIENLAEFTQRFLVGAECGYDEGLQLIGKGTTIKIIENAASVLSCYGLADRAEFSFILGLPWETRTEVEKTLRFASHLFATYGVKVVLQWYVQIPGSRLWEEARQKGLVHEVMYDEFGFFRNLYLFCTGVHLSPKDIWEVARIAEMLKGLGWMRYPGRQLVESALPVPIHENFPETTLHPSGLISLREVSHPESGGVISFR